MDGYVSMVSSRSECCFVGGREVNRLSMGLCGSCTCEVSTVEPAAVECLCRCLGVIMVSL